MTTAVATEGRIEITDHWDVVEATVADVHFRYAKHVDRDDLLQEAAVWWYGPGQKYLPSYLTDASLTRLRRSIWRWCARFAEREKATLAGYEPSDQVRYSPRQVLDMLQLAMDPDGLPDGGGVHEGPAPKGNLAEGGDVLATLIDVRRALAVVPEADLHFLNLAHDLSLDWERVAAHMAGGLPDSLRRRYARIAERMARWLNKDLEDE